MKRTSHMNIPNRQAGFSIIELMIAVALGLIVLAALTTFFVQTSANRTEMERNTRQIENGRYAIDTLRDDVSLAGFFADLAPGVVPNWQVPDACPASLAATGYALVPDYRVPVPVFGYTLGVGAPATCLQDLIPGNDILVVRRFGSEPFTPAQALLNADRWYLQNAQCATDLEDFPLEPFVVAAGGGPFPKRTVKCGVDYASVWRLREQVYYLRSCSVCSPSDNIPTLWRAELDPVALVTMKHYPVVEGIEALRFDYGIDNTGDGLPDVWTRSPATPADWGNVTAVKVYLLSRNLEESPNWVDNKTYNLGLWGDTVAVNDKIKRHVYTALIALPNRAGPREPQLVAAPVIP
jgi:type IV pilus assembly protein PilW